VVAEDVVALTLVSPAGETLPSWSPGAHIDLVLADDLVRQYSLCSSPGEDGAWRIGVLRTPDSEWVRRLALRLGEDGSVVGPAEVVADVRREAGAALAQYGTAGAGGPPVSPEG
jgi:ferredoxin-NADP reductase